MENQIVSACNNNIIPSYRKTTKPKLSFRTSFDSSDITKHERLHAALLVGNILLSAVSNFCPAQSACMALTLQFVTYVTLQRDKETVICALILNEIKEFVSLCLGQKIDDQTETDLPGFPRSPNYTIRATFATYEISCRGDPRDYSTTLKSSLIQLASQGQRIRPALYLTPCTTI